MQHPSQAAAQTPPTGASPAPRSPAGRPMNPRKRPIDGDQAGDDAASETVRCEMQVMSDGSTEDCEHPGIAPWLVSGAGGLTLAMMGLAGGGGGSGAGAPAPSPAPSPVPELPPLAAAPKLSTSTGGEAVNGTGHVQVQLAEPGGRWVYRVDAETRWREGTGTRIDGSTLTEGLHAVVVAQVDAQGRHGDPATLAVRIDNAVAPPALALKQDTGDSSSDGLTRDGTVQVSGLEDGAAWWYRVDGIGEWQSGQGSEVQVDGGRQGTRTVEVYQIDAAGNRSEVGQLSFELDTLAPQAPGVTTSTGTDLIGVNDAVRIDGIESGSHWEYSVNDDGSFHAAEGGALPAGVLKEGANVLRVVQVDAAGNRSEVVERAIRYDTTAPDGLVLTTSTSTGEIGASGEVRVAGIDPDAAWFFRVNGAETWTRGTGSTVPASALKEGPNTIEAYQVDGVGLNSPRTNLAVTLDLTPPPAPMLQSSNGTDLLNANGFVNVTALEGGASWAYRLNGQGEWIAGDGGRIPASALHNGDNAIEVRQTDSAGNVGAVATLQVRVDLDAPEALAVQVTGGAQDALPMSGALTLQQLEPGATWRYRLNGETVWRVGTGDRLDASALQEGANDIEFFQTDTSGHDSGITRLSVTRDSLAPDRPDLVTSNGLPVINASGSLLVNLLEDEPTTWEYRVNGGAWTAGQGKSISSAVLQENDNTVEVRQTDVAGNVSGIDSLSVRLDTQAPDELQTTARVRAGTAAPNKLINATGYISLDNLESDASWEFKINGDQYWRKGSGKQLSTRVLDENVNTIEFRQIDAAGNIGLTHSESVTLDSIAPATPSITTSTGGTQLGSGSYLNFGEVEPGSVLTVNINGVTHILQGNTPRIQAYGPRGTRPGDNVVTAFQTDAAGNVSATQSLSFNVDVADPVQLNLIKHYDGDGALNSNFDLILIGGLEPNATWWYRIDGGMWNQGTESSLAGDVFKPSAGAVPSVIDANGRGYSRNLEAYQVDHAGNVGLLNFLTVTYYVMP